MIKNKILTILIVLGSLFMATTVYAINDIEIDGNLSDWADETGFFTDPYNDSNPDRTDMTQYGLAVVDNGSDPESLALVMVVDEAPNNSKMTFYVGGTHPPAADNHPLYEIVVDISAGCLFGEVNITYDDGINPPVPVPSPSYEAAVFAVDPPVYASPDPADDTTPDCAGEFEFPISTLPFLDSDGDGQLLDESFPTSFVTRESGGQGSDKDYSDIGNIGPTAISLKEFRVRTNQTNVILYPLIGVLLITTLAVLPQIRARLR